MNQEDPPQVPEDPDRPQSVADRIEEIAPADGASVMTQLSAANAPPTSPGILDPETAAGKILSRMEPSHAAIVINDMPAPEASMVLAAMDPDDRVDVLAHVPEPRHGELMREFTQQDADEVRQLEQYPPDTAGGIMTTQVTSLPEDITCEEAVAQLRPAQRRAGADVLSVYVVDRRRHLIGVLSMRDLILSKPDRRVNPDHASPTSLACRPPWTRKKSPGPCGGIQIPGRARRRRAPSPSRNHHSPRRHRRSHHRRSDRRRAEDVRRRCRRERLLSPWQFSFRKKNLVAGGESGHGVSRRLGRELVR